MAIQAKAKPTKSAKATSRSSAAKNTSQVFVWQGTDKRGNRTKGEVSSSNMALAKAELRRQGIIAAKIKKKPKPLFGDGDRKSVV